MFSWILVLKIYFALDFELLLDQAVLVIDNTEIYNIF